MIVRAACDAHSEWQRQPPPWDKVDQTRLCQPEFGSKKLFTAQATGAHAHTAASARTPPHSVPSRAAEDSAACDTEAHAFAPRNCPRPAVQSSTSRMPEPLTRMAQAMHSAVYQQVTAHHRVPCMVWKKARTRLLATRTAWAFAVVCHSPPAAPHAECVAKRHRKRDSTHIVLVVCVLGLALCHLAPSAAADSCPLLPHSP